MDTTGGGVEMIGGGVETTGGEVETTGGGSVLASAGDDKLAMTGEDKTLGLGPGSEGIGCRRGLVVVNIKIG